MQKTARDRFPPGPKTLLPLGHLKTLQRDPIGFFLELKDYGDIAHFRVATQDIYFLNHPDLIRDVLVTNQRKFVKSRALQRAKSVLGEGLLTSEGELHLRQRRLMQPAFHHQRIASYGDTMIRYSQRHMARWHDGQTLNMHEEMMRLTLAIVAKTLFDADVEAEAAEIGEALGELLELFEVAPSPFAELLDHLPLPRNKRFQRAKARIDATIYRIIESRRRSGEDKGDLLSMLLMAQDGDQDADDNAGMTDQQVRDEAVTLFLAGHETTANALSWTWYLLAQHPEVEAKLHQELEAVLGANPPTVEKLKELTYTRMVLAEALRLYPPSYVIGRLSKEEHALAGYRVPAGSILIMSQYVLHRDPRYHEEPERFVPERFEPERQAAQTKFSYFPFGGGPRVCIGEPFAWMEGVLILATLAQRWRARLVPEHPVELQPLITLRPKHGVRMTLEPRGA